MNAVRFARFSFNPQLKTLGIAYTIDPEYEAEVREYLGQYTSSAYA